MSLMKKLKLATGKAYTFGRVGLYIGRRQKNKLSARSLHDLFDFNIDNEECVILANGPSLKDSLADNNTYDFIKKRKKFCVNSMPKSEEFWNLQPEYMCLMDPLYWAREVRDELKSEFLNIAENLKKVTWKFTLFLPLHAQEWNWFIDIPAINPNIQIVYLSTKTIEGTQEERFLAYEQNIAMPCVQNVLVSCVFLAINMGFNKTYIFGADHSWHENLYMREDNVLCIKDTHFFDKKEIVITPMYCGPAKDKIFTMCTIFEAFSKKHQSYMELEEYAKYKNKKVYNASAYSWVDAFERVKIE